jgi:hypothetical protein
MCIHIESIDQTEVNTIRHNIKLMLGEENNYGNICSSKHCKQRKEVNEQKKKFFLEKFRKFKIKCYYYVLYRV